MLHSLRPNRSLKELKAITRQYTLSNIDPEDNVITADLELELQQEQQKTRKIQENLRINQELLAKKEQSNRRTLNELEEKLRGRKWITDPSLSQNTLKNMEKIQEAHAEIMDKLSTVQHKTVQIMLDQEKEIIKDYKDRFSHVELEIATSRLLSTKQKSPVNKELSLWENIQTCTRENKNKEMLNQKLTQINSDLKLDIREQANEISGMKFQIDALRIQNFRLKQELTQCRMLGYASSPVKPSEIIASTQRDFTSMSIDTIKSEIAKCKKEEKKASGNLFVVQESTTELKFLLKQGLEDIGKKIKNLNKIGKDGNALEIEKLSELRKAAGRLYDTTFPPRTGIQKKANLLPRNKIDDIEFTMQAIQNLYEKYESDLKKKL